MTKAEAIVRELADISPVDEWGDCRFCGVTLKYGERQPHKDECLFRRAEDWAKEAEREARFWPACEFCREYEGKMAPSHCGSKSCESGSLASGGTVKHCTCDTCF